MPFDTDSTSTETLVLRARRGEDGAMDRLLQVSYLPLLRTAAQLLRDDDAAQDVVQETLIKIARRIGQLAEPAAFPGWARTILRREAHEHFRSRQRRPAGQVEYDDNRLELQSAAEQARFEASEEMRHCLDVLRTEDRRIIDLHYWGGLEVREIGAVLGIAAGAVKTRLFRARNRLRHRLCKLDSTLVPQA